MFKKPPQTDLLGISYNNMAFKNHAGCSVNNEMKPKSRHSLENKNEDNLRLEIKITLGDQEENCHERKLYKARVAAEEVLSPELLRDLRCAAFIPEDEPRRKVAWVPPGRVLCLLALCWENPSP